MLTKVLDPFFSFIETLLSHHAYITKGTYTSHTKGCSTVMSLHQTWYSLFTNSSRLKQLLILGLRTFRFSIFLSRLFIHSKFRKLLKSDTSFEMNNIMHDISKLGAGTIHHVTLERVPSSYRLPCSYGLLVQQQNSVAFSPQVNYTDWAIQAGWWIYLHFCG
jgi:hypothetical protein